MRALIFRSPSPMQNPCSSSPFFLSLSKNYSKTMEKMMAMEWIRGPPRSPDTSEIYRQNNAKPQEVEKAREENRTTGWKTPHHGRGLTTVRPWLPPWAVVSTTVWPWWLLWWPPGCGGVSVFWWFALGRGFCLSLGYFGPLCKLLLILMAHTSLAWIHLKHFSQNLGLNHRNL